MILDVRGNRIDRSSLMERVWEQAFLRATEKQLELALMAKYGGYRVWLPHSVRRKLDKENPKTIKFDFMPRGDNR